MTRRRSAQDARSYASRAADKLAAALDGFALDPAGWTCADFGANVGGFTDCLLRRGAAKVYAVETGSGALAWKLRRDARVVVMERTNALYCPVPEPVDLVVVDMGWTPQELAVPAALRWLKPPAPHCPEGGRIVSLLKCHYELAKAGRAGAKRRIDDERAEEVCRGVCLRLEASGVRVRGVLRSPLRGKGGGAEFLLSLTASRPGGPGRKQS